MTVQLELTTLKRDWCDTTLEQMLCGIQSGIEFTTDEIHDEVGAPSHPNLWGVLFAKMKASGRFVKVGYRPSRRPEANGRVVAVWRAA